MDFLFIILVLENIIERFIPAFAYLDESITIFCGLLIVFKLSHPIKINKTYIKIGVSFVIVALLGLISNVVFQIQDEVIAVLKDVLAFSKFYVIFLASLICFENGIKERIYKRMCSFAKLYVIVLFAFAVLNVFLDVGMDDGYRYGIKTYMFLYSHPTFMVSSVVAICTILIAEGRRKNMPYIVMACVVIALGLRNKGFIYICVLAFASVILKGLPGFRSKLNNFRLTRKRKFQVSVGILCACAIGFWLAKSKILDYFSWGLTAARPALYIVSFSIMRDYFPLGSGFGTFASSLSGEYYSPLYYMYRIQNVSGLERDLGYAYIADTFWPYIFGQFGVLGTFIYFLSLYYVARCIISKYQGDRYKFIASLSLFIYLVAGCFVESMMTNSFIAMYALILGFYLNVNKKNSITYR